MLVEALGVFQAYDRSRPVLVDVSVRVDSGQSVAVVGPSGSGKTTLLSILGLLTLPDAGSVLFDGTPGTPASRRDMAHRIGWVFQTPALLGRRTVGDNIALGVLAVGGSRGQAAARARAVAEHVGLGALLDAQAFRLSGGEAQRVMVGRALAASPSLILADEPTGQLDRTTSDAVVDLLLGERPDGDQPTIIVATHDRSIAARCDRVLELVDGSLREL